jgi:hypothetical protein
VLRSGSGVCAGLLCSGCSLLRSAEVLPGSGLMLCSGEVLRSSEVLPRSGDLWLPGSSVLRSAEVLPGSGFVLCSGLCAEVLCPGSGDLLRSGRPGLQHLQYVQQLQ